MSSAFFQSHTVARSIAAFLEAIDRPAMVPDEFDIAVATKYRNWREDDVAPRTLWDELQFMKQICNFAYAWQSQTHAEAVRLVKLPYVELPDGGGKALTENEFGTVLDATRTDRDREILIQGVTTRLRRANLLGLRGEWFDRPRKWLTIGRDLLKGGRRKVRGDLSVPVATWTIQTLGDRRKGLLWPNERTGRPLGWFEHVLEQLAEDSGVVFSLHDLRTTGNSWLDAAGVDKLMQAYLLGHSTSSDVTDLYRRKFEKEQRAAVHVFDQIRARNRW